MNLITLLFAVLNTIVVLIYIADSLKAKKNVGLFYPLVASFAVGSAVVLLLGELVNETTVFFILSFAVLFAVLPFYYIRNTKKLFAFLALVLIEFFYVTYIYGSVLYPFIQMLAIGTGFGMLARGGFGALGYKRESRSFETRRDVIHILLGVVLLALFLVLPFYYAVYATTTLILIGYLYNSTIGKRQKGSAYSILRSFERDGSIYGAGALYLGVGVALLLGFIHNLHFIIIGISALLFADPIATIVGINFGKLKLFYNKKKSVAGTIAFFVVVSIVGFPFIGYYSLLFGLGLALVESTRLPVDDNITIAVVMIILYIIFLAYVGHLPF